MKKFTILVIAVVGISIFLGTVPHLERANANFLQDFFKSLVGPLSPRVEAPREGEKGVELYKPALDYEQAVIHAVEQTSPAVVSIIISKYLPVIEQCPYNPFSDLPPEFQGLLDDQFLFYRPCERGAELREVGGGSGFIISRNGLILTNKHVINDRDASYTAFTNDGRQFDAQVLARDPVQDLAVIKINATDLPTVTLGDSDNIKLGQTVIAIGNALGEFRNTVSTGVISGLARDITASDGDGAAERISGVIQTDAAINPGNSGGPLLNLRGEVIGVNTAVVSGAENIGFAIPINEAKRDIESVQRTGEIQIPFLGVRYITITPQRAEEEELPVNEGALVRGNEGEPAVQPDSPAARAGLQEGDIILEVNGMPLTTDTTLVDVISRLHVGQTITLIVHRKGKQLTLTATLGKRPAL